MGLPRQLRYVCLVVDSNGQRALVEFRERHWPIIEVMRNAGGGEVGTVCVMHKTGEANNSPVEIRVTGKEKVISQDISRLVECLGLPAKHVNLETVENQDVLDEIISRVFSTDQREAVNPSEVEPT